MIRPRSTQAIRQRKQRGTNFSIVVVAEGALSVADNKNTTAEEEKDQGAEDKDAKAEKKATEELRPFDLYRSNNTLSSAISWKR